MYSIKFIPYSYAIDSGKKGIHVLSADEYKWRVRYPETLKELKEIFDENSGLRVIWELPMGKKTGDKMAFPKGGISVVILTTYRNTNLEGHNSLRVEEYIAYDCTMYGMNANGKTIDRVGQKN